MLLRSRGSTLVAKQNCSATSFTRNGSIRAVLKPLRDGFHLIFVKPLSALGGSLCNISSNYCSLQRFSYCLKLMIFNHSTFFHTCKLLFSSFSQMYFSTSLRSISSATASSPCRLSSTCRRYLVSTAVIFRPAASRFCRLA